MIKDLFPQETSGGAVKTSGGGKKHQVVPCDPETERPDQVGPKWSSQIEGGTETMVLRVGQRQWLPFDSICAVVTVAKACCYLFMKTWTLPVLSWALCC